MKKNKKTTKKTIDKRESLDICFSACRDCMFWLEDLEVPRIGVCIRHAPRPYYAIYSTCAEHQEKREKGRVFWPETRAIDVCGEWQPKEIEQNTEDEDIIF